MARSIAWLALYRSTEFLWGWHVQAIRIHSIWTFFFLFLFLAITQSVPMKVFLVFNIPRCFLFLFSYGCMVKHFIFYFFIFYWWWTLKLPGSLWHGVTKTHTKYNNTHNSFTICDQKSLWENKDRKVRGGHFYIYSEEADYIYIYIVQQDIYI